jgi:hypothetical protein
MSNKLYHIGCMHERHRPYLAVFDGAHSSAMGMSKISEFILDPKQDPKNPDDLELFQDLVFEGPGGRVHICFYDDLFRNWYAIIPEQTIVEFGRYLDFLHQISSLYSKDAIHFVFKRHDPFIINSLLKTLSNDIRMCFVREALTRPEIMQLSDKLKLYNVFS